MTILFLGQEDIDWVGGGNVSTSGRDAAYTSTTYQPGMGASSGGIYPAVPVWTGYTDLWAHGYSAGETDSGTGVAEWLAFSRTTPGGRHIGCLRSLQGNNGQLFADDGTGVRLLGTPFTFSGPDRYFDLHVAIDADNLEALVEIYQSGLLIHSHTFTLVAPYELKHFTFSGAAGPPSWSYRISQCIIADESTIGWRMYQRRPTANGDLAQWAGDFSDLNEDTLDAVGSIAANSPADSTFVRSSLTVPNSMEVKAVALVGWYRSGDPAITEITELFRIAGATFPGDPFPVGELFSYKQTIYHENPATALPWTNSSVSGNALQFGVRV